MAKIVMHISRIAKEKIEAFEKDHGCTAKRPNPGLLGTRYKYTFTPSNVGILAEIKCFWCKQKYESGMLESEIEDAPTLSEQIKIKARAWLNFFFKRKAKNPE